MTDRETIVGLLLDAIDDVNPQLPPAQRLERRPDTALFGKSGKLDSLALVTLIVDVEQKLEERLGITLVLADERAMSQTRSPFRDLPSLADYIVVLLDEASRG